jgi:aryl-alcohol dehydrogenase-like predicted oxidoreductase
MALDQHFLLGRSGLRVSRVALGTMNFGTGGFHAAYGLDQDRAAPIFHRYLELPYSLIDRDIEAEHVAAGQELGLGVTAWSPLGGGFLTGKYSRDGATGDGRLAGQDSWTDQQWELLRTLEKVAGELNVTMAQVALNWVVTQPGIAAAIVGASSVSQLDSSLAALDFELPEPLRQELDAASAVPLGKPYVMFTPQYQSWIVSPGNKVGDKPAGYQPPVRNWV